MTGRVDRIDVQPAIEHYKAKKLDFSAILMPPPVQDTSSRRSLKRPEHSLESSLEPELLAAAIPALERKEPVKLERPIRNVHRTVGGGLSGEIVRRHGPAGLPEGTIQISFKGSAGQSFGAFLAPGVTLRVEGDANDYVGKGMSGGRIVITPPKGARIRPHENVIAGNTVLYGATGGELFIHGTVGERFAVRNSGAKVVVEGCGDHGCEYMTGGIAVILGQTGNNFAAGMSGGVAYVHDDTEWFGIRCNLDMVDLESVWKEEDRRVLRTLLENYLKETGSARAKMILENWETHLPLFVKVMPVDYRKTLERMRMEEHPDNETVSATEEVFGV